MRRRLENPDSSLHDGRKLGLIVEGGGMRGVLSAGSLLALDLLGYRRFVDAVFAVSAGSVNAAYFLSGQGQLGITVYFDDLTGPRFLNPLRPWKIADVDYVYDQVVSKDKPLDEEAIRKSPQEFYFTATEVTTGNNVLVDVKRSDSIVRCLKASSALPVLYNRVVALGGPDYVDGGVSGGLPVRQAIEHGCTDLLVLLSRPTTFPVQSPSCLDRWTLAVMMGVRYPALNRSLRTPFR